MSRLMRETFLPSLLKITKIMCKYQKITIDQEDDYTAGCLLNFPYFEGNYKMIAIDLSKQ